MLRKLGTSVVALCMAAGFSMVACSDDDSGAVCGNGVIEGSEVCDSAAVGDHTCSDEGFSGGVLSCNATCEGYDTSQCTNDTTCGDNVQEGTEDCDGADLDNTTCQDRGFDGGVLACTGACTFDISGCTNGCTNDCPAEDDTRCVGEVLGVCTVGADGCLDWVDTDCTATSQICDDSGATAVCADECTSTCTTIGATECIDDNNINTCQDGGDGCMYWTGTPCTGGYCAGNPAACFTSGSGLACDDVYRLDHRTFPHTMTGFWSNGPFTFHGTCQDGANPVYLSYTVQGAAIDHLIFYVEETVSISWPEVSAWTTTEATGFCDGAQMTEIGCDTGSSDNRTLVLDSTSLAQGNVIYFLLSADGLTYPLNDPDITVFEQTCGNGVIEQTEECDDANATLGDGCDADCQLETGFWCTGEPSICMIPACGDGYVNDAAEECDDSNATPGDGCDATCLIETGYWCSGIQSSCDLQYTKDATATYSWVDISTTGNTVLLDDDDFGGPFPTGFSFTYYGQTFTDFYIGSNGHITFGEGSDDRSNNCPMNTDTNPPNIIALMWDDLDPFDSSDPAYYEHFASCPYGTTQGCLVVQFSNYSHYPGGTNNAGTFQAILFADGSILIQFQDVGTELGSDSTTGIMGPLGSNGATDHVCDTAGSLAANDAICFSPAGVTGCQ